MPPPKPTSFFLKNCSTLPFIFFNTLAGRYASHFLVKAAKSPSHRVFLQVVFANINSFFTDLLFHGVKTFSLNVLLIQTLTALLMELTPLPRVFARWPFLQDGCIVVRAVRLACGYFVSFSTAYNAGFSLLHCYIYTLMSCNGSAFYGFLIKMASGVPLAENTIAVYPFINHLIFFFPLLWYILNPSIASVDFVLFVVALEHATTTFLYWHKSCAWLL